MPLRYLTPFTFLALVPLGGWLGGAWTFMAAAATPLCLASLDAMFGDEPAQATSPNGVLLWIPPTYILLQVAATAWAIGWVMRPQTSVLEACGLALSIGVTTGVFGFVAAHEMIHSRDPRARGVGLMLLGSVFYMHFRIAHVYGHHRRAATREDPASARLGEGLYAFLARSIGGQMGEAWAFELRRLRRLNRSPIGFGNRMVAYFSIEAAWLFSLVLLGWRAAAFAVAVAFVAIVLLEAFNYVAHYGLSRQVSAGHRVERLAAKHSWNSGRRMNNAALFNMGRHSDHHWHPTRHYEQLEPLPGAVELPFGYAGALLTALAPPVWRRIMDQRAAAANAGRGGAS